MLYLKVPELHSRVSVLEHELWFPAMTLGSTDLYVLHDSDSTRIYVGGHSGDVLTSLKKNIFFSAIRCPTFGDDKTAGRVLKGHSKPASSGCNT